MSRHQRLQHTLRSPVRRHKQQKNRKTRQLRRAISQAFDKVINPHFPGGFHVTRRPVVTPEQHLRALMKVKRREKCDRQAAVRRQVKRAEAEARNAATLPANRSRKRAAPVSRHERREAGQ